MDCLVEIGIWKLKRDYCHYLIGIFFNNTCINIIIIII